MELQDVKTVDVARQAHAERSIGALCGDATCARMNSYFPLRQTTHLPDVP
jgi:hypothetical protein